MRLFESEMSHRIKFIYSILLVFFLVHTTAFFAKFGAARASVVDTSELKQNIRSLATGTQNGIKAATDSRIAINGAVRKLEKANPVKKLSSTEKLDGSWKLVYTTNEGSSAGKLGPFVGDVIQDIDLSTKKYVNFVRLPFIEGALTATWDALNDKTWRVRFQSIKFSIAGIPIVKKELQAEGIWRLSYVDDDLRVLYAQGGKSSTENIYILSK